MFEVLQNFGNSLTHNFISKNLVGSAFNITTSNFHKEGCVYSIGINESMFHYMCSVLKKCKKNWDFQCQYLSNVEKMRRNALNLPHGIGGWIQLMGFVDSKFHLNIQLINANLMSVHHQPHGLV